MGDSRMISARNSCSGIVNDIFSQSSTDALDDDRMCSALALGDLEHAPGNDSAPAGADGERSLLQDSGGVSDGNFPDIQTSPPGEISQSRRGCADDGRLGRMQPDF